METFQKIVLVVAIVTLCIVLLTIGILLAKTSYGVAWPPVIPKCPDYWLSDDSGCKNTHKLGKCNLDGSSIDFVKAPFNDETCAKKKWATNCQVAWDGITYGGSSETC